MEKLQMLFTKNSLRSMLFSIVHCHRCEVVIMSTARVRMMKAISGIFAFVLCGALGAAAQDLQVFKGEITDAKCAGPAEGGAVVERGEATLSCSGAHPTKGAKYVLSSAEDKTIYQLDSQRKSKAFLGQKVLV